MSKFQDIDRQLEKFGKELRDQVPEDWTHPESDRIVEELRSITNHKEKKNEDSGKLIAFPAWLSNLSTGIAASLVTAFCFFNFYSDPAIPVDADVAHRVPDLSSERSRGLSDESPPETDGSVGSFDLQQAEAFTLTLDINFIERTRRALEETSDASEPNILNARSSMLGALKRYLDAIRLSDKPAADAAKQELERWLRVFEANR